MTLADFSNFSIKLWNAKWACTYTELAANASIGIYDNWAFFVFRDCIDWACRCTCGVLAVHASPIEETPRGFVIILIIVKLESYVGISVKGQFLRVSPFTAECCCFSLAVVPAFASHLTCSATDA